MAGGGIKYRFATGPDGKPVDAAELARAESFDPNSFTCLQCERVMNARVSSSHISAIEPGLIARLPATWKRRPSNFSATFTMSLLKKGRHFRFG
jgi:hypothetical protein